MGGISEPEQVFMGRLLAALPELRPRYEAAGAQARADGLEDGAAYFFLDEYARELLGRFAADPVGTTPPLTALAGVLEAEFGTDMDVDSLISGTLLALMPGRASDPSVTPDPADLLGPKLRAEFDRDRNWRARPEDAALVERMVTAVPALAPLAQENTFGDHGDVLVHIFLGDVVAREVENFEAGERDEVLAVLDLVEREFAGTDEPQRNADEAIAVSFVENLPYPGEPGAGIVDLLGPKLRAELGRQRADLF
jgi:hypothetical protein